MTRKEGKGGGGCEASFGAEVRRCSARTGKEVNDAASSQMFLTCSCEMKPNMFTSSQLRGARQDGRGEQTGGGWDSGWRFGGLSACTSVDALTQLRRRTAKVQNSKRVSGAPGRTSRRVLFLIDKWRRRGCGEP